MKIVQVDNFDRDYISDTLIAENVNKHFGEFLVKALNEKYSRGDSAEYYRLEPDDYKLHIWEP